MNRYSAIYIALLVIIQAMILNNIHLFGYATPLLLVYVVIGFPKVTPRWMSLIIAFCIGLISDIFNNTPGISAAALTFTAFIQPTILSLSTTRDTPETMVPAIKSMGIAKFATYSTILIFINTTMVFTLDNFTFAHWRQWITGIIGSILITFIMVLTMETFRKK